MSKSTPFFLLTTLTLSFGGLLHAAVPQLVSVTPSSGTGQSQTFTVTASDTDGASDIFSIALIANSVFDGESGCWLNWENNGQAFFNTDGYNWVYLAPGANLGNSRCSVQFVSATSSGNSVSVSFNISFNSTMTGTQNIYAQAMNQTGKVTGYQQLGSWTVPTVTAGPDFQASITPASQAMNPGYPVTYNVSVASLNGFAGTVQWNAAPLQPVEGLTTMPSGTSLVVPANGSASATIVLSAAQSATDGIVNLNANFQSGALEHTIPFSTQITHIQLPGNNPPGPVLSFNMTTPVTPTETFTITAASPSGYSAVTGINFLINSSLDGQNACWLYYAPSASGNGGTLSLASDDETSWSSTPISAGWNSSNPILENSQCSTSGGPITVNGSGDTVTLKITLTMGPNFRGVRNVYLRASDQAGEDTGYLLMGDYGLPAATSADFTVSVTPGASVTTPGGEAFWQLTVNPVNGYEGTPSFSLAGLPPGSTSGTTAVITPGQSDTIYVNIPSGTALGTYPVTVTVTDGFLTHSASADLVVQAAGLPVLSEYTNTPPGTTRTYHVTAQNQSGSAPGSMNILIANSVDGQHACWLYYDLQMYLASDDGSTWLTAAPGGTLSNSQCSVTWTDGSTGPLLVANVTITMLGQFIGNKNIYMRSSNQVGDTGYQLEGTWTTQ